MCSFYQALPFVTLRGLSLWAFGRPNSGGHRGGEIEKWKAKLNRHTLGTVQHTPKETAFTEKRKEGIGKKVD